MTKRILDVLISAVVLFLTSPILLFLGLLLRVSYGSPVLFKQIRVGRFGETFVIHKFRTMRESSGPLITVDGDARVHSVGRFLRYSKLDELPQLWDVLVGTMSLVGPRPEVPEFVELWPPEDRDIILSVRPGITDPASVLFRNEAGILGRYSDPKRAYIDSVMPVKCRIYLEYVNNASIRNDFKILSKTLFALVRPPKVEFDG